jgi:hypothetical protein
MFICFLPDSDFDLRGAHDRNESQGEHTGSKLWVSVLKASRCLFQIRYYKVDAGKLGTREA